MSDEFGPVTEAELDAAREPCACVRPAPEPQARYDERESGEKCERCGRRYLTCWGAPDGLWRAVTGHGDEGLLCPACFDATAREHGVILVWRVDPTLKDGVLPGYDATPEPQADALEAIKWRNRGAATPGLLSAAWVRDHVPMATRLLAESETDRHTLLAHVDRLTRERDEARDLGLLIASWLGNGPGGGEWTNRSDMETRIKQGVDTHIRVRSGLISDLRRRLAHAQSRREKALLNSWGWMAGTFLLRDYFVGARRVIWGARNQLSRHALHREARHG